MLTGSAKILFYNDNANAIIASAGRISTTKGNAEEIYEKALAKKPEDNVNLIKKIISSGHTSVLEHCFLNLCFNNVSVFAEQFIIEFRLASFTVKSRRYVDFSGMGYVLPDFKKYGEKAGRMEKIYKDHMNYLFAKYDEFIEKGAPKEDARFILPYCFRSNFYCTVNAREFCKIVNEAIWGRGSQYPELKALGESLAEQAKKELPFLTIGEKYCAKPYKDALSERELYEISKEFNVGEPSEISFECSTPQPEKVICKAVMANVGALNWQSADIDEPSLQKRILKSALNVGRKRELEQVNFNISFPRVSLSGVTHIVRHRMHSVIVPKYVNACDFSKYVVPQSIVDIGLKDEYDKIFAKSGEVKNALLADDLNVSDSVYLLLSGLTVPITTTMNANELHTFIRLRTCNRAQWEIRNDARELLFKLRKKYPVLFSFYGPTCYCAGVCPEGKMTCGQSESVRELFGAE